MTTFQFKRQHEKTPTKRRIAEAHDALSLQHAKLIGVANWQAAILHRGLLGRLKWALVKK